MEFENLIKLIDTVSASELTGFKYEEKGLKLQMSKGDGEVKVVAAPAAPLPAAPLPAGPAPAPAAEAPAHGVSVIDYAPRSNPAMDFENLCDEIAGRDFPRRENREEK